MTNRLLDFVDAFLPENIPNNEAERLMARTFVGLHLVGPLMGHSVTYFLAVSGAAKSWQFWLTEVVVAGFFAIPLLLKWSGSLKLSAMVSTQMLVFLSLFGSFFFGGISSPFLPWFLIAMILGFFYLSDDIKRMLTGLAIQIAMFFTARLMLGDFPEILPLESLKMANLLSIVAATAYMTMLALYYETVMRVNAELEREAIEQRAKLAALRDAMKNAEVASTRKSIFLAKMSHELRTPLNAVIGYSELLMDNFEAAKSERKIQDLERIRTAGRHLLGLVNNVIDISSIEAERVELNVTQVDLAALLADVATTATPLVEKRQNTLSMTIDPAVGMVELDAMKLKQSLLNLLSNASKFTTRGTIECNVTGQTIAGREMLILEVADNGIGMSKEGAQRLFSDFTQAEDDTSTKFGGTGLGLALTHRFCEMMGGDISVRSQRGVGTIFTIRIPWKAVPDRAIRTKAA